MNKMEEVKIVVDGLRNGMFENYSDLDEAVLPHFEYLLSVIELVEMDLTFMKNYGEANNVVDQIKFSVDSALKVIRGGLVCQ